MNFTLRLLAIFLLCSFGTRAQRNCGSPIPSAEWDEWFNKKVIEHTHNVALGKAQNANFTVPVIVHVIHGGQAVGTYPNISQAQVNSQIPVLNDDYAGVGFNVGSLATTGFSTVGAANCSISFSLALKDPSGNNLAEPGIDRVAFNTISSTNPATITSQTQFQNFVDGTIKPATIWDPVRYFNIWVTDVNSNVGLLGYSTFPIGTGLVGISGNGSATTDGIWVWSKCFGSTGVLSQPYTRGRTATHETGHWLGLRHINGDANCGNDYCNDTPPQKALNFGCPTYPWNTAAAVTCGSLYGDMFMNFMDYSDDACLAIFTPNQSTRITTAMNVGTYRNQLTASSATLCGAIVATMPTSDFSLPGTGCVDSPILLTNLSTGSPTPTYSWSVLPYPGGAFTPNSNVISPNVIFSGNGNYTVTMSASNSAGTATLSKVIVVNSCADVGIKTTSILLNSIVLSPNPTSGILNISNSSSQNQVLDITIHNYLGQFVTSTTIKDTNANGSNLDMTDYSNGVYFVTISNGKEKIVKRIILNK